MKGKKMLSTSLIMLLIISMAMLNTGVVSADPDLPWLSVEPPLTVVNGTSPGEHLNEKFNVTVVVHNVTNYYGADFNLKYNDTLLEYTGFYYRGTNAVINVVPGGLPDAALTVTDVSVSGTVKVSILFKESYTPRPPSFNGTGVVAWVEFKIIYVPSQGTAPPEFNTVGCDLEFDETWTFIYDDTPAVQSRDPCVNGEYLYGMKNLVPGAPTAEFTWSPAYPKECDTVTLDASTSDPGPSPATITSYKWIIVSGPATLTGPDNTETTTMHCDGAGTVTVNLNITNSFGLWDDVTHDIEQREVVGGELDLYTDEKRFCGQTTPNVGIGLGENCDALSPDINVTLFAKVTWNGKPVMHVLVAFEIIYEWVEVNQELGFPDGYEPLNETKAIRTAETDKDGIATTWFRIPNPCTEPVFGKWLVISKGKIQEIPYEDYMRFDVGYVIHLLEVTTLKEVDQVWQPWGTFEAPCDWMGFDIKLKNIMWIDKNVTLHIVVYDDCDVPVGKVTIKKLIEGGVYCSPHSETIEILNAIHLPQWTYVGTGKVYVSAYTAMPHDCGVPYCPEVSAEFLLEWSGET